MIYDPTFNDYSLENNPYLVGQGVIVSDSMILHIPIVFELNLAYQESDYVNNIVKEATAALKGMTNLKLVSFEIGNEPDLYLKNGFRNGSWGG